MAGLRVYSRFRSVCFADMVVWRYAAGAVSTPTRGADRLMDGTSLLVSPQGVAWATARFANPLPISAVVLWFEWILLLTLPFHRR